MMGDLGDTVVGEHGQGGYARAGTAWEEGMGGRGVIRKEGGPRFSDENLGALPKEDCSTAMRERTGDQSRVRTPVSAEGSLVSKTRKDVSDGLDEFQGGSSATSGCLEDIQEARIRSAIVLHASVRRRSITVPTDNDVLRRGSNRLAS